MRKLVDIQETLSYSVWINVPDNASEEEIENEANRMITDGELIDIEDQSIQTDGFGLTFVQILDDPIPDPMLNQEYIEAVKNQLRGNNG